MNKGYGGMSKETLGRASEHPHSLTEEREREVTFHISFWSLVSLRLKSKAVAAVHILLWCENTPFVTGVKF
jgi:hypothetical protein